MMEDVEDVVYKFSRARFPFGSLPLFFSVHGRSVSVASRFDFRCATVVL